MWRGGVPLLLPPWDLTRLTRCCLQRPDLYGGDLGGVRSWEWVGGEAGPDTEGG